MGKEADRHTECICGWWRTLSLSCSFLALNPQQTGYRGECSSAPPFCPHCSLASPVPAPIHRPEAEEPPPLPLIQHRSPALSSSLAPAPAVCHRDHFCHTPGGIFIPAYPMGCGGGLPAHISPLSRGRAYRKNLWRRRCRGGLKSLMVLMGGTGGLMHQWAKLSCKGDVEIPVM